MSFSAAAIASAWRGILGNVMVGRHMLRILSAAAIAAAALLPANAATIGASYFIEFEDSLTFGAPLPGDFDISEVVTATVTQTTEDSARFDFSFFGTTGAITFAGFFLAEGTSYTHHSGGEVVQDVSNTRSIFGDRDIPHGLSFGSGRTGFVSGDQLSFSLSSTSGLDIEDWSSFLHSGNNSGLFGGIAYVSDTHASVFGVTGLGAQNAQRVLTNAPPPIAAVPLPASGLLVLAGLGALALLRRKTSQPTRA